MKKIQSKFSSSWNHRARTAEVDAGANRLALISQRFDDGWSAIEQGRFGDARHSFQVVLSLQPDHFGALQLLGAIELHAHRYKNASKLLARALEINRGHAESLYNYGAAMHGLGHLTTALDSYDAALAIKPDYPDALYNRGNALLELKRYQDALDSYDRAIKARSDFAEAHSNRANALHALRRFDEALDSYDSAISCKPDYSIAHATASYALRIGLPLLTLAGRSFASRVADSLLVAMGLPELVAHSQDQYQLSLWWQTAPTGRSPAGSSHS